MNLVYKFLSGTVILPGVAKEILPWLVDDIEGILESQGTDISEAVKDHNTNIELPLIRITCINDSSKYDKCYSILISFSVRENMFIAYDRLDASVCMYSPDKTVEYVMKDFIRLVMEQQ